MQLLVGPHLRGASLSVVVRQEMIVQLLDERARCCDKLLRTWEKLGLQLGRDSLEFTDQVVHPVFFSLADQDGPFSDGPVRVFPHRLELEDMILGTFDELPLKALVCAAIPLFPMLWGNVRDRLQGLDYVCPQPALPP